MAYEIPILPVPFLAEEDLSSYQWCFVCLSTTNGNVRLLNNGTEPAIGILQNAPTAGQVADVMIEGISKVKLGSAGLVNNGFIAPEYNSATDNGKAVNCAYNAQTRAGRLIETATAEDDLATCLLIPR